MSKTRNAWRRFKLLVAEALILSIAKGDHSHGFMHHLLDAADQVRNFRATYYPKGRP